MKKKIVFAGHGYVGKAMIELFTHRDDIYDLRWWAPETTIFSKEDCATADLCVIAVPTPMSEGGEVDTSNVESVFEWCDAKLYLIKSTIPPGTTAKLREKTGKRIVFSPEYIGEGKYYVAPWKYPHPTEVIHHEFQIFGGLKEDTSEVVNFFTPIMGPTKKYMITDDRTAEFVKYSENIWGAMKVTWANEMYEAAKRMGVSWVEARELFLLDGRVEPMHTVVFPEKRGWGGKCYPKDLMGFIMHCRKNGYQPELLQEVVRSNARFSSDPEMQKLPAIIDTYGE